MYDSVNLPLSKKKIIKKTLDVWFSNLIGLLLMIVLFAGALIFIVSTSSEAEGIRGLSFSIIVFVTFIILASITFFIWLYQYYYYKLYYYNFTEDGAEIKKGVFSRATGHIRYEKLQNIYVDQDFLDRIFGLYDIHYETAGEFSGFYSHVDGLEQENANKLVAFLNEKARGSGSINASRASAKANTAKVAQKSAKTVKSSKSGTAESNSQYDNVVLTRDNVPMDSKIIYLQTLGSFIGLLFMVGFFAIFIVMFAIGKNSTTGNDLNISAGTIWITSGVILLILLIMSYVYNLVWFKNFYFKFDNEKGEITSKVLGMSTSYLYYDRIQNVNVNQGFFDRMFGMYTISVETAGELSGLGLVLTGFRQEQAELLKNYLLDKAKSYKRNF